MRALLAAAGLAAAALAVAGCGGSDKSTTPAIDVRGDEYAYVLPDRIEGGVVAMRFTNTGKELHEYALGRLADPGAAAELRDAIAKNDRDRFMELVDDVGGVPALSPGEEVSITRELDPGTYVLLCFVPAPDGMPHVAKGMLRTFEVEGRSEAGLPQADAVIVAQDKSFEIPKLEAGEQTIELRNEAASPREFYLLAPKGGASIADVERWGEGGFKGKPVATFFGAMQSIPPKTSVYLGIDLEAGARYVLFDEDLREAEFTVAG